MKRNAFSGMAAILFLGGIAALIAGHVWWREYRSIGAWDRAPAMIHSSSLHYHRDRMPDGSDSSYYENSAHYTYLYNNREYQGRRVGLLDKGSQAGHHRRWHETLQRHQRSREAIMIWVNPSNPSQAIIFREATLVHYMLPSIGIACLLLAMLSWLYWYCTAPPQYRPGKRPWQQEGLWQDNTARYEPWDDVRDTGAATIAAIIIAITVIFGLSKSEGGSWVLPMQWLIGLAPLACLVYGGYQVSRALRYGKTHLAIQRIPLVPGTTMQAYLVSKRPLAMSTLHCTIRCERRRMEMRHKTGGRGTEMVKVVDIVYEESWDIPVEDGGKPSRKHGWIVPISKDIPSPLPERNIYAREPIYWTLTLSGKTPGINFHARYPLPVFDSPE